MTHEGGATIQRWCPGCLATVGDLPTCPQCGLPGQDGAEASRLRVVVSRIHDVATERAALEHELDDLVGERAQLFARLRPPPPTTAPVAAPRAEWRPERVRDVLLWLGALLLVAAAITFAAVAWTRVGPAGRAGMLLVVTAASGVLTAYVARTLRPTAEALAGITVALALVTWGVARHTQLPGGMSDMLWWSIGLAIVGTACAAIAARADLTAIRLGAVSLYPFAAIFALGAWKPARPVTVVALALLTGAVVVTRSVARGRWQTVRPWLGVLAGAGEIAVVIGAILAAVDTWHGPGHAGAAVAVLSVALAPLVSLWSPDRSVRPDPGPAAFLATVAVLGAGVVAVGDAVDAAWLLAGLAVAATVVVVAARSLPTRARVGVTAAALLASAVPAVAAIGDVVRAWLGPTGWLGRPWTGSLAAPVTDRIGRVAAVSVHDAGPTLVVLASLAVLALVTTHGRPPVERAVLPAVLAALGLSVVVAAADVTVATALAIQLAVAVALVVAAIVTDRRDGGLPAALALIGVAGVVVVPAVGWAAVTPTASLLALAVAVGAGAFAAAAFRTPALQAGATLVAGGAFLGGAAVVLSERGVAAEPAGVVVVGLAVVLLVASRSVPWPASHAWVGVTLEAVACTGALLGAGAAGTDPSARLVAYALVTVALVAAATHRDERAGTYGALAVVAGALAGVVGLAAAVTHSIASEWVTLPAAAVATAIALLPEWQGRDSARRFGPGLLLAAITSVGLAVDRGGWRVLVVIAVAGAVLAVGARARQGAPIVVGAASLLVLAVDAGAPYVAAVPRWLLIGTAGALALWAGATADRRLAQLRHWRDTFDRLA